TARWPCSKMVAQPEVSVRVYPDGRVSRVGRRVSGVGCSSEVDAVSGTRCVPVVEAVAGGSCGSGLAQLTIKDRIGAAIKQARIMMTVAVQRLSSVAGTLRPLR